MTLAAEPASASSRTWSEPLAFAAMVLALVILPAYVYPGILMKGLCFALFACAFNLLIGYGGLLSFGHALFFGWAAYVAAHLAKVGTISLPYWYAARTWQWLTIPLPPLPPELAILAGGLVAALFGLIVGALAIRRRGIYFAMITLALAQMMFFFAVQAPFTHGEDGIQAVPRGTLLVLPAPVFAIVYWIGFALMLAALFGLLLPSLAVQVRRLHDVNRSGWYWLLNFVPFGPLVLLVWSCMRGSAGSNRFGPAPQPVDLRSAAATCLAKYATFSGRAARSELWLFALLHLLALIVAGAVLAVSAGPFDLSRQMTMYYVVLAIFLVCFLAIWRIINSPFGEVLKAIRENEQRAISLGYRVDRYKLVAFVLSAFFAGIAGATKSIVFQLASLTDVDWPMSGEVILMTLVGGLGTVFGPVAGAFFVVTLENYLTTFGNWVFVVQGSIFVVCVLAFRRGVVGEVAHWLRVKL